MTTDQTLRAADALSPSMLARMREIIERYPRPRSAIMPLLHLVQAEQGYVTPQGLEAVADELDLTAAEVAAVVSFYTMYKRRPVGDYHVGVCTNTLCAVMGGDAIFSSLKDHLDVGNDETTPDGKVTLEHIECNAACDYAPVVMVNWEFFDNQTVESARELVDRLRAGNPPAPTRGARLVTWREAELVLAGFPDGRANDGPSAGPASLAGLQTAAQRGESAPAMPAPDKADRDASDSEERATESAAADVAAQGAGRSGRDTGAATAESEPASGTAPQAAAMSQSAEQSPDRAAGTPGSQEEGQAEGQEGQEGQVEGQQKGRDA